MAHYLHTAVDVGTRADTLAKSKEFGALRCELGAILTTLEHRKVWKPGIVPLALVAHANQLMNALEDHLHSRLVLPARQSEADSLRGRLAGVRKAIGRQ